MSVVKFFYVARDGIFCFFFRGIGVMVGQFGLQGFEKALCHGIVIAVSPAAHATGYLACAFQHGSKPQADVLCTLVRVEQQLLAAL